MGKSLETEAVRVNVADVIHHGDKLILPEKMTIPDAIELLERRQKYLLEDVVLHEAFDVFPWDGAHALMKVLIKRYGWAPAEPIPGFFGPTPPQLQAVEVAPGKFEQVPVGRFSLPGVTGFIQTGHDHKNGRVVFKLSGKVRRTDEENIKALFEEIRTYLVTGSIYRGQAVKIRFRDNDGDPLDMPEPKFLDTSKIDVNGLIFSDDVMELVETNLFTPIQRVEDCLANGVPVKRGVLLGGPFGTGKTLAAHVASRHAVDSGITYIYVPRADELSDAIEFGKQYQSPACVIFVEDIDRSMGGERTVEMDDILNIIDGIDTKSANIIVVMTTNALDNINPAMLRPGRLDAVIEIPAPDQVAVQKLLRLYGGEAIDADADLSEAGEVLKGNIPAVIAEVVKRAKLAQLGLQPRGTKVTSISGEALVRTAKTMTRQVDILKAAAEKKDPAPTVGDLLAKTVEDAVVASVGRQIEKTKDNAVAVAEHLGVAQ